MQQAKLKQIEDERRQREERARQVQQYLANAPADEQQLAALDPQGFTKNLLAKKKAEFEHTLDLARIGAAGENQMDLARFRAAQERSAPVRYGVDPSYEIDEKGTVYEVAHGNDGSRLVRELTAKPFAVTRYTPEFKGKVASTVKSEEMKVEARLTAEQEYPQIKSTSDIALRALYDALDDEKGMQRAVGLSSIFPSIPGGASANYDRRFAQIEGSVAMIAYETLKGGGHITEKEIQWGTAAKTDIALSQSYDRHRESANLLIKIIENGERRAAKKAGRETKPLHVINPPRRYAEIKAKQDARDALLQGVEPDPFGIGN
jgi:hypothetical protein